MPRAPATNGANHKVHENGHSHEKGNGFGASFDHGAAASPTNGHAKVPVMGEPATNGASLVTRGHAPAWRAGEAAAWLSAYEAIQCRTAEAHAVYQQTMAQCHLAFLRAAEQSALALASLAVGAPALPLAASPYDHAPRPAAPPSRGIALPSPVEDGYGNGLPPIQWSPPAHPPAPAIARAPMPPMPPPMPVPVSDAGLTSIPAHAPVVRAPAPAPRAPAPAPVHVEAKAPVAPAAAPAPAAPAKPAGLPADGDLKTFLFNVISEKTGYPVEILNLDQQLEADLGIDSIKRVEILSAFEGQIPDIKDINLEEVASLSTLRDVVGFMEKFSAQLGLEKKKD